MIVQYPHTASVFTNQDATLDENGNWVEGSLNNAISFKCRAEPVTGDGYVTGADGSRIDFNWVVYCPLGTPVIEVGTPITVYGLTQVTDTVKRYSRGQLNVRIWL